MFQQTKFLWKFAGIQFVRNTSLNINIQVFIFFRPVSGTYLKLETTNRLPKSALEPGQSVSQVRLLSLVFGMDELDGCDEHNYERCL